MEGKLRLAPNNIIEGTWSILLYISIDSYDLKKCWHAWFFGDCIFFFWFLFCLCKKLSLLVPLCHSFMKKTPFFSFLLQGFPSSVTPDYVPFQVWDSLQVTANPFDR